MIYHEGGRIGELQSHNFSIVHVLWEPCRRLNISGDALHTAVKNHTFTTLTGTYARINHVSVLIPKRFQSQLLLLQRRYWFHALGVYQVRSLKRGMTVPFLVRVHFHPLGGEKWA